MLNSMIQTLQKERRGRMVITLLGLQWGDEGKGKVSDSITQYFNKDEYIVVGPNGGGNAGHNVVIEKSASTGGKIKLAFHELPGGAVGAEHIFLSQARIINFLNLIKEVQQIELHQPSERRKIYIASRAIVNIDGVYNRIETVTEEAKGAQKVGSTKQGIGPAYAGEALRTAITAGQMFTLSDTVLESKIQEQCSTFPYLNKAEILATMFQTKKTVEDMIKAGKIEIVSDDFLTTDVVKDKHVLVEGSQSVGLGKFGGAYPNNTSSDCSLHGLLSACLLPRADLVCGVAKAIVSKVGGGRFANRLDDNGVPADLVEEYRQIAGEFGATTGRPRQVGFFDAVQMKHSFKTGNQPDVLWINMGDLLKFFADKGVDNKIVVGYKVDRYSAGQGKRTSVVLTDSIPLQEDEVKEIMFETLPAVKDIEKDLPVWLSVIRQKIDYKGPVVVGVGPGANDNILFEK